ncbi:MAG: radical SAM protein [Thaumarchaeota archaeon]|nr:radical SAM protein [Nitrososphaerota archaeon]
MEELEVRETTCKTLLHRLDYGGSSEYTANFYKGCLHGCVYCYVPSLIHEDRRWGRFVDVKVNAPEVLDSELRRTKKGPVFLSSATDPYQQVEGRYRITRRCLRSLRAQGFPTIILTRSPLVLRDLDILRQFDWVRVGFSISSVPDRLYEPRVSPLERRIESLRRLGDAGIRTWVSLAPLIPKLMMVELPDLLGRLRRAGVSAVSPGLIRFQGYPESKQMFENSLGISSEGLAEGGDDIIADARKLIDGLGFQSTADFFDWRRETGLEGYMNPIT